METLHDSTSAGAAPSKEANEGARKVVSSLLLVRKHLSLYPEGHTIPEKALVGFHELLAAHLKKHGELKIDVERDRLLFQGEVVHSGDGEEGALPFILFRDGIRWIGFADGIEVQELRELLRIVIRYGILSDEAEGDIVTSLWEAGFPHVKYEVSDFAWEDSDDLQGGPAASESTGRRIPKESRPADRPTLNAPPIDEAELAFTPEDEVAARELNRLEQERPHGVYLDSLFDSLIYYREKANYELILGVLAEEVKGSFSVMDFEGVLKILSRLKLVGDACRTDSMPAGAQLVDEFFSSLSTPQFLGPLQEVWSRVDPARIKYVRQILSFLQPEAIVTLCHMLAQEQPPEVHQMLVQTVVTLASRDFGPLEALLKSPDEKLVQSLVQVMAGLEGEQPVKILLTMVRHPSERVRQEALRGIFQKHPDRIKEVLGLIDDPDESIRRVILKHISLSRDRNAERFLLNYLELNKASQRDDEHIIACFTALGQCGSSRSLPFLRKTLYQWAWMPLFWKRAYRLGAAAALSRLGTSEAQQVLNRAARSLSPFLRAIARRSGN
ncbi:MAG TPA: HEAT repeat domain-containing protein [Deltaproteobacteria bacterium]|jgi:hypothetical protein|nr:HEAT repeat domain-containing protein [Deltaproteobacteria bacterium]HOI06547.1 HEAT repeat domain-containing protein [Deltaproteobacteria bacterium]